MRPPGPWLKDPADPIHAMPPAAFAAVAARRGLADDATVVAYDDFNGSWATRLCGR